MKFGQYLKALDLDAPTEWHGKFLNYRKLKKTLKGLGSCVDLMKHGDSKCCHDKRDAFFDCLHREVHRVNREFQVAARAVIRDSESGSRSRWLFKCFSIPPVQGEDCKAENLILRAEWCRRFSQINSVALRKILKKYDKLSESREGMEYLQRVWSGNLRACGTFLHSPLLEELKSLQAMLEAHLPNQAALRGTLERQRTISVELGESERAELPMLPSLRSNLNVSQHFEGNIEEATPLQTSTDGSTRGGNASAATDAGPHLRSISHVQLHHLPGASEEVNRAVDANESTIRQSLYLRNISLASSGLGNRDEPEVANEHLCPICLEAMYQPIGLECGHAFCADCAFTSAGKGNAVGSVRAILDHVSPEACCPECRTKGVYILAIELKETEKLIKQRYPKQWAERAEDAKAKEKRLRELLAIQRRSVYHNFRVPF